MTARIYVIRSTDGQARLVRATHPANALRYVAADSFTVAVATQDELVLLLGKGARVEDIKAEQPCAN